MQFGTGAITTDASDCSEYEKHSIYIIHVLILFFLYLKCMAQTCVGCCCFAQIFHGTVHLASTYWLVSGYCQREIKLMATEQTIALNGTLSNYRCAQFDRLLICEQGSSTLNWKIAKCISFLSCHLHSTTHFHRPTTIIIIIRVHVFQFSTHDFNCILTIKKYLTLINQKKVVYPTDMVCKNSYNSRRY